MGRNSFAAVLVAFCVLASAAALIQGARAPQSEEACPAPMTAPVAPDSAKATVVGSMDFSPSVLNLHSAGRYVSLRLSLPEGYPASSVYIPSVRFMGVVYAETCFTDHETGADKENSPHVVLKFLRADVEAVLGTGDLVPVFLTGMLTDGTPFCASGTLTITA